MRIEKILVTHVVDGQPKEVELPLAPTPLAKLVDLKENFLLGTSSVDGMTPESARSLIEAVFHGVRRAGGAVTLEWLLENIDSESETGVFAAFMRVNGFKLKDPDTGEAKAGAAS